MVAVLPSMLAQVDEPLIRWGWLGDHVDEIVQRTVQHLQLTAVSLGLGLVVSLVLASVIRRWRWTTTPILGLTTLLYAVPSIAMFAALLPLFGIGLTVPTVVLTTYSLVVLTPFLVDAFDGDAPRTSGLEAKLKGLDIGKRPLIVTEDASESLYLSARNLPYVEVRDVQGLDPVALVGADTVVVTSDAVKKIEEWLA